MRIGDDVRIRFFGRAPERIHHVPKLWGGGRKTPAHIDDRAPKVAIVLGCALTRFGPVQRIETAFFLHDFFRAVELFEQRFQQRRAVKDIVLDDRF